jgi:hypothetical protein
VADGPRVRGRRPDRATYSRHRSRRSRALGMRHGRRVLAPSPQPRVSMDLPARAARDCAPRARANRLAPPGRVQRRRPPRPVPHHPAEEPPSTTGPRTRTHAAGRTQASDPALDRRTDPRRPRRLTRGRSTWPPSTEFRCAGLGSVLRRINSRGQRDRWARHYNLDPPTPPMRWTDHKIEAALHRFLEGRQEWPSYRDFQKAGLGGLRANTGRAGTQRIWAERYGLAPAHRIRKTSHAEAGGRLAL